MTRFLIKDTIPGKYFIGKTTDKLAGHPDWPTFENEDGELVGVHKSRVVVELKEDE